MARTNKALVQGILDEYDSRRSLDPFIATATVIVDRVQACAANKGKTLTAAELELLERWLAAHCYAMTDQVAMDRRTGDARDIYGGKTGDRLSATKYGQTALTLDYSGCLNALDKRQTATMTWAGKTPTEQVPFWDRG